MAEIAAQRPTPRHEGREHTGGHAEGRRERKKARTRQAIADAALELFLARGFDQVTIKDVAEAADVSVSGLFKHFPTKESLVVGQDEDVRAALVAAVRDRPAAAPVLPAVRAWLAGHLHARRDDPAGAALLDLIAATPALGDHARRVWLRNEEALAEAIAAAGPDTPGSGIAARAVARFALDPARPQGHEDARADLDAAYALLSDGWPAPELRLPPPDHPPAETSAEAQKPPAPARPPGLRERKKAQTRKAIRQTARELFTEQGYDNVGVRQVADAAGTSLATLFTYFPDGKASLVFPGDQSDTVTALVDTVHHRAPGQTVVRALHDYMATRGPFKPDPTPDEQQVLALVRATPELSDYALHTWSLAEPPLTAAIAHEAALPAGDPTVRLLVHYLLQIPDLARTAPDARLALDVITGVLEHGWPAALTRPQPRT